MTVENENDALPAIPSAPQARRQGERPGWNRPRVGAEYDEEPIFPPISAPLPWPRVFPSL